MCCQSSFVLDPSNPIAFLTLISLFYLIVSYNVGLLGMSFLRTIQMNLTIVSWFDRPWIFNLSNKSKATFQSEDHHPVHVLYWFKRPDEHLIVANAPRNSSRRLFEITLTVNIMVPLFESSHDLEDLHFGLLFHSSVIAYHTRWFQILIGFSLKPKRFMDSQWFLPLFQLILHQHYICYLHLNQLKYYFPQFLSHSKICYYYSLLLVLYYHLKCYLHLPSSCYQETFWQYFMI